MFVKRVLLLKYKVTKEKKKSFGNAIFFLDNRSPGKNLEWLTIITSRMARQT
jgi:hypothetical protein